MRLLSLFVFILGISTTGWAEPLEGTSEPPVWRPKGVPGRASSSKLGDLRGGKPVVKKGELEKAIQAEIVKPLSVPEEPYPEGYMVARVRLTNPNDYAVAFTGKGNPQSIRIGQAWQRLEDGEWKEYAFDFCGTGRRIYRIEPGASEEVTFFFPPWRPQRAILTLRHAEKPEYQSTVAIILADEGANVE